MARRNRRTTRPAPRESTAERRIPVSETRDPARGRPRARVARSGTPRAVGEPSAALERAALAERTFVLRDSRRLAMVVAAMMALLVASGFVVNALFP